MILADEPFAPLSEDETAEQPTAKKSAEKKPIVPVPADAPPCTFKIPRLGGAPVKMWAYRDSEGRLLGYDARFEYEQDGKRLKDVLPVTFCEEGDKRVWRSKSFPSPRPLYGLDRLTSRPASPVVIVEGCKAADAAGQLLPDYVAMSWPGGGNAISHADWSALQGRDVLIWPDRDRQHYVGGAEKPYEEQPGTISADNIVGRLKGIARSIQLLDLSAWDCESGWDAADAVEEGWTPEQARSFVAARASEIDQAAPGTIMPYGFEYGEQGLYYVESGSQSFRIAGRLKVIAKTRDLGGHSWGLLLDWRDDDGVEHRWSMPRAMLAGDGSAVREALLDRGLFVSTASKARTRLLEFLSSVDTEVRARAVTKVGWSGSAFALPHLTIGDTPTDRVIFQHPEAAPHNYVTAGTLQDWQEQVAKLAIGNSRLVFMISAALVGPVLTPACEEGGGVNVVGSSSTGKTTGLMAAASVWGPPSFVRTWRATGNGLEGTAAQHSETLLCLDELGQLDPREAGQVAYMLGNGMGKQRSSRSGSSRAVSTWKLMYLSTGEVGLAELSREGKNTRTPQAGQEVRILDVPADAGKGMGLFENIHGADSPEVFSRQIKTAAAAYHGTAAMAFLGALAAVRDRIGDMVAESLRQFGSKYVQPNADGQVLRAARRFGLVAAAGELAVALGILPWAAGEASGAAGVMFRAWVERRGGTGAAEDRNILECLQLFIQAHGGSRFSPIVLADNELHRPVINRAGFWRSATHDGDTIREYLFLPESFKEVFAGFDQPHVKKLLADRGILIGDKGGKFSQVVTLPELGKKRCYVINVARLGDGD